MLGIWTKGSPISVPYSAHEALQMAPIRPCGTPPERAHAEGASEKEKETGKTGQDEPKGRFHPLFLAI